jgi:hypothetical protein
MSKSKSKFQVDPTDEMTYLSTLYQDAPPKKARKIELVES